MYLNDWLNPRGCSFADLAIRIRGIQATRALSLFIPFSVSKEELRDISLLLRDEQILRATFSAGCIIDYLKNDCTSEIAYNGRTVDLVHISRFDFSLEPLADGTMLFINLEALRGYLANDEAYFLFCLPHKYLDEVFCRKINVGGLLGRVRDLLTTPVLSEKYGYSVRINEARLLPPEINRMGAFHRQKLEKAVITLSINDAYEVSDRNCYRIRRLEEDLYRGYAPEGFSCEDVITYQWNQTREHDLRGHFNFYFDIERIHQPNEYVCLYACAAYGRCRRQCTLDAHPISAWLVREESNETNAESIRRICSGASADLILFVFFTMPFKRWAARQGI